MRAKSLLQVVLLCGTVPGSSGCLGYAIGYAVDASNRQVITPSRPGLPAIPRGKGVTVVLRSGHKLKGTYNGVKPLPVDDYARLYAAGRDSLAASIPGLPALGDTVTVSLQTGESVEVEFLGCDWDGLAIRRLSGGQVETMSTIAVRDVLPQGRPVVSGATLDVLVSRGDLPVRTAIVLRESRKDHLVALTEIARVERMPSSGRTWGFVTDLVLEAAALVIVAATWEGSW